MEERVHRNVTEVSHSDDLYKNDRNDRNTEKMGEFEKNHEDTYHQGQGRTGGIESKTGSSNAAMPQSSHKLPNSYEKIGPSNTPHHFTKGEFSKAKPLEHKSPSGASLVYVTIDNEEHARRFVKRLFSKGLIAQAELANGGFERSYLMFGTIHTDQQKVYLQLTTTDERVPELIDFVNNNNPSEYDYPMPDIVVEPI